MVLKKLSGLQYCAKVYADLNGSYEVFKLIDITPKPTINDFHHTEY